MSLNLRGYDHGRTDSFKSIAARVYKLTSLLGETARELRSWQGKVADSLLPLGSERDAQTLVAACARMWKSGDRELVAYGPAAVATYEGATVGQVAFVAGIAPTDLPVWVPNQADLKLTGAAELELRFDPARLEAAFRAFITATEPAWAHVAIDDVPTGPVPPFHDGAPIVGWMTYLSSAYPAVPALPSPAVVKEAPSGTLVIAHSSKFDAAQIRAVAKALEEAKVLLSLRDLQKRQT